MKMAHICSAETRNAVTLMKYVLALDNIFVHNHKHFIWTCTLEIGATRVCEGNAPQFLERLKAVVGKHIYRFNH